MTQSPATSTADALRDMASLLDGIDHAARARLDDQTRLEVITLARTVARRTDALVRVLVAEADDAESSARSRGTPTTSWLGTDPTTTRREASALVLSGRDLACNPLLRQASLEGTVSVLQTRLLARAFAEIPDTLDEHKKAVVQQGLLDRAAELHPSTMHQTVLAAIQQAAPEAIPGPEEQQQRLEAQKRRAYARRHLRLTHDGDGSVDIRGSLPALEAEPLVSLLHALVESERRARRTARDRLDPRGEPTPDQRRADALVTLVQHAGRRAGRVGQAPASGAEAPASSTGGVRPRVVVTMSEQSLRERAEQAGALPDGSLVSAGDLRRICCDAELVPVVLGGRSEILDVGRAHRLVTPALRQALSIRDGGCVFPGCGAEDSRCEAHHIDPWWKGGPTALHNLVLVCPRHHGLVEPVRFWSGAPPDRWEIRLDAQGQVVVVPPARMDPDRRPLPHVNRRCPHAPAESAAEVRRLRKERDAHADPSPADDPARSGTGGREEQPCLIA